MRVIKANWDIPENVYAFTTLEDNPWPIHSRENPDRLANIAKFSKYYSLPKDPFLVKQYHSNLVVSADTGESNTMEADASYTFERNNPLAILTADCIPILIYSKDGVAAIHAGWRGLVSGVIENTVARVSSNTSEVSAWIGPCIRRDSFLVREDFFHNLESLGYRKDYIASFASQVNGEQWSFDLVAMAIDKLVSIGFSKEKIFDSGVCTFKDLRMLSHRRTMGKDCRRIVSLIWKS